jgi:hypothetical protein
MAIKKTSNKLIKSGTKSKERAVLATAEPRRGTEVKSLYKTTIVIWSIDDPTSKMELADLAREATDGAMYCSQCMAVKVEDPLADPTWDNTEFFNDLAEDDGSGDGSEDIV